MVYLDFNSTAPYSPGVTRYIQEGMCSDWANPSSEHDLGYFLSAKIKNDRQVIADFFDCGAGKLFFTSGATESVNSVLSPYNVSSRKVTTIISSPLEHSCTLVCCRNLKKLGYTVCEVEHDEFGRVDLCKLNHLCKSNPHSLVSLLYVNNETGVITPIDEVIKIARHNNCLIHIDAVQALGKIEVNLDRLDVDFASFSGHKIGSLKGVGILYIKESEQFKPLILGGHQERSIRSGTYNFSAIHSFRLAIEDLNFEKNIFIKDLRDNFEKEFLKINSTFELNGIDAPRVPNTSSIYLGGRESREVMLRLAAAGIAVSTGSACNEGMQSPSHVIISMRSSRKIAQSTLRISIGTQTTKEEIDLLIKTIREIDIFELT